ncbi:MULTISPECIES: membrane protein insertion efficiency factor YidD [unclassified Campylobacter]|uniref:membrane protein insertion efficiency factor YidD n=1 Tax=unclassified Campylobacter TaxID=2593542 RepID=UPI0022EA02A4|nr:MULTISPECIES: membrane protein insertion efficiency factor YidD [unclassified Campylobacter]MDA3042561.1 membrane protein insertion efficiency factor YidD [Campylobacter sp. JMF_09 ED2]MDA3044625.1 membrane protein insertion efficiency factor YidD [Campylobacter sp. JMF_07 ED4]MDA3063252.1 membrane protein insertion efficiency factor YidD [Campylobacter sp. JMF_11 EL3]MDA3071602.1 membrane protein insertion efficiency factor YidD [Campylobacter sp. VBCF_03 NA9]MDA3074334.1 membrane protein 
MRNFCVFLIKFYRAFISPLLPASCRYYPTCSTYALYQFKFNHPLHAFFATLIRILKCNPFFKGGIDYPIIKHNFKFNFFWACKNSALGVKPKIWFIPYSKNQYYIIFRR